MLWELQLVAGQRSAGLVVQEESRRLRALIDGADAAPPGCRHIARTQQGATPGTARKAHLDKRYSLISEYE